MSKVIVFSSSERSMPQSTKDRKRSHSALTTADYRRMLSELKFRPPSQRAFLRKLLIRAMVAGSKQFPVASHVVPNLATPS